MPACLSGSAGSWWCSPIMSGPGAGSAATRPAAWSFARWDPPDGISPALTSYIDKRGFRGPGLGPRCRRRLLNLAVKGLVELDDLGSDLTIRRTDAPGAQGPAGPARRR